MLECGDALSLTDDRAVSRLLCSASAGVAPVHAFRMLAGGRATDAISSGDLRRLLRVIASAPQGWPVAIDILAMRFHSTFANDGERLGMAALGRELLLQFDPLAKSHRELGYNLATLASACLDGPDAQNTAATLCGALAGAFIKRTLALHELHALVLALFRRQPMAALDAFALASSEPEENRNLLRMFDEFVEHFRHPLREVSDEAILAWCAQDPGRNYEAAASCIPFSKASAGPSVAGWSDIALQVLRRAPDRVAVLRCFVERFSPMAWSGSRAAIVEANAALLTPIEEWDDPEVARLAREERERLLEEAWMEREREAEWHGRRDERFE